MSVIGHSWTVPFCPDCGQAGKHAPTCGIFPGDPVVRGNFEDVVLASQLRGAVEALEQIKRIAAIEAPPVSDEVPAKVWQVAFDALNRFGGAVDVVAPDSCGVLPVPPPLWCSLPRTTHDDPQPTH